MRWMWTLGAAALLLGCGPEVANLSQSAEAQRDLLVTMGGTKACKAGLVECPGSRKKCIDLAKDPRNCGACGYGCAAEWGCKAGVCVPPANGCASNAECDDGDAATIDVCVAGACQHSPAGCASTADCDDADPCTDDSCNASRVCIHTAKSCDDANACTLDACETTTGACTHTTITCSDGDVCTTDTCDPSEGCAYVPRSCDDANACTTDACGSSGDCIHASISCDDGDACTVDSCDPTAGCAHAPVNCDDGDATTTDTCVAGTCTHTPASLYAPVGPQTDVAVSALTGWTLCYADTYANSMWFGDRTPLASIQAACSKARLLLACRASGSTTLTLLAWAPREDVLQPTGAPSGAGGDPATAHVANGTAWHYWPGSGSYSWGGWGFAAAGSPIYKDSCDINDTSFRVGDGTGALRLCWNTGWTSDEGRIDAGFRCGSWVQGDISSGGAWDRLIYHAD
jgi:hypothetical protein